MKFMKGYKSYAAGVLAILGGLTAIITQVKDGAWNWDELQSGWLMIVNGLGIIGLRNSQADIAAKL